MDVQLQWDNEAETIVRWDFTGWLGTLNYLIPINETARMSIFADEPIAAIINIGWHMAFPNRPFKYLRQAILAAPPGLRMIIIACPNPLARLIMRARLLDDILSNRVILVNSLAAARRLTAE